MSFSLRIVAGLQTPTACNNTEFESRINEVISAYVKSNMMILAERYAYNIANGRFLWRNRVGAEQIKIRVSGKGLNEIIEFNAYDYSLAQTTSDNAKVKHLAEAIQAGFTGEEIIILKIDAFAKLGGSQRVWPSQEMVLNASKGEKSRHLFSLNDVQGVDNVAAVHCEKIGNALRTIDDWYPDYEKTKKPIAIEAYGSVTQRGVAYRSARNDFKTLLLKWLDPEKSASLTDTDKHFVVAMLIRGGVFGEGES